MKLGLLYRHALLPKMHCSFNWRFITGVLTSKLSNGYYLHNITLLCIWIKMGEWFVYSVVDDMSKVRRVLLQIKSKISYTLKLIVTYTFFVTETPGNEEASQFKRKTFSFIATSSKSKHWIYMPSFCYSMFLEYGFTILDLVTLNISAFIWKIK